MKSRKEVDRLATDYFQRLSEALDKLQADWGRRFDDAVAAGEWDAPAAAASKSALRDHFQAALSNARDELARALDQHWSVDAV